MPMTNNVSNVKPKPVFSRRLSLMLFMLLASLNFNNVNSFTMKVKSTLKLPITPRLGEAPAVVENIFSKDQGKWYFVPGTGDDIGYLEFHPSWSGYFNTAKGEKNFDGIFVQTPRAVFVWHLDIDGSVENYVGPSMSLVRANPDFLQEVGIASEEGFDVLQLPADSLQKIGSVKNIKAVMSSFNKDLTNNWSMHPFAPSLPDLGNDLQAAADIDNVLSPEYWDAMGEDNQNEFIISILTRTASMLTTGETSFYDNVGQKYPNYVAEYKTYEPTRQKVIEAFNAVKGTDGFMDKVQAISKPMFEFTQNYLKNKYNSAGFYVNEMLNQRDSEATLELCQTRRREAVTDRKGSPFAGLVAGSTDDANFSAHLNNFVLDDIPGPADNLGDPLKEILDIVWPALVDKAKEVNMEEFGGSYEKNLHSIKGATQIRLADKNVLAEGGDESIDTYKNKLLPKLILYNCLINSYFVGLMKTIEDKVWTFFETPNEKYPEMSRFFVEEKSQKSTFPNVFQWFRIHGYILWHYSDIKRQNPLPLSIMKFETRNLLLV